MRLPEDKPPPGTSHPRGGKQHERDQSLRYLSPGAFTILPPDDMHPDPSTAPAPYRLTPKSRRHKNQAFAIIAEPSSNPGSRSPSPSGRVSPFRGRGFNPIGSRHASPAPSPPPADDRNYHRHHRTTPNSTRTSPKKSQIPKLQRRASSSGSSVFGENVTHSPQRHGSNLSPKLSKSLTNLPPKKVHYKPQESPRRTYGKAPAFQQLSPIAGSSPEIPPDQSSKTPRGRSQPPSRHDSPARKTSPTHKHPSRSQSRNASRNASRDASPTKVLTSPTKTRNYKNVQAKVNSFNKPKPKVPPKPEVLSSYTEPKINNSVSNSTDDVRNRNNPKPQLSRKDSVNKFNNTPRTNNKANTNSNSSINKSVNSSMASLNNKNNNNSNNSNSNTSINTDQNSKISNSRNDINANSNKNDVNGNSKLGSTTTLQSRDSNGNNMKKSESLATVASNKATPGSKLASNTELSKLDPRTEDNGHERVSPMVDGRVLSATSVSNAINKMNDTVMSTNTVMKESNFSKLSPAASAIISMSNAVDNCKEYRKDPTEKRDNQLERSSPKKSVAPTSQVDHKTHTQLPNNVHNTDVNKVGNFVNNVSRFSSDHRLGSVNNGSQKSLTDRLIDARTVVAADVKPLRINVKEKPVGVEVQSGNVRLHPVAANGVSEIPGLPPTQPPQNESQEQEPPKTNACTRFFSSCKSKVPGACCKKPPKDVLDNAEIKNEEKQKPTTCFSCRKCNKEKDEERENLAGSESEKKPGCFERLKCCGRNKIADKTKSKSLCSRANIRERWARRAVRADSILSEAPRSRCCNCSKLACKNFFKKLFCVNRCCKKEDPISRRESVLSKKKSLTSTAVPTPEDTTPKLDLSLVEHTSHMKAAIPVLPIKLAWFCLICNIFLPGTGTVFSGLFCLCIGKPRFSQKDGPKQRIGAFIIDLFIGCGQLFTVLFCLVGWGWSIWWGMIMLKLAKKQEKIKLAERSNSIEERQIPAVHQNHRDIERGGS